MSKKTLKHPSKTKHESIEEFVQGENPQRTPELNLVEEPTEASLDNEPERVSVSLYVPEDIWIQLKLDALEMEIPARELCERILASNEPENLPIPNQRPNTIHTTVELTKSLWNTYRRASLIRSCSATSLVHGAFEKAFV